MKVYCRNCKYYEKNPTPTSLKILRMEHVCWYSENIKTKRRQSFLEEVSERIPIKSPEKINKNNNCKWYARIESQEVGE